MLMDAKFEYEANLLFDAVFLFSQNFRHIYLKFSYILFKISINFIQNLPTIYPNFLKYVQHFFDFFLKIFFKIYPLFW